MQIKKHNIGQKKDNLTIDNKDIINNLENKENLTIESDNCINYKREKNL